MKTSERLVGVLVMLAMSMVGSMALGAPPARATATTRSAGYWLESRDGGVFAFGGAPFLGSAIDQCTLQCWGFTATGSGNGYWVVDT